MRYMIYLLLLLTAALPGSLLAAPLIVDKGQPNAQIVIAESPTRMTRLAANELQAYVRKITGAELPITSQPDDTYPIRLLIGPSPAAEAIGLSADGLEHGAYHLKSGDDWLAFIGQDADFVPRGPWGEKSGTANRRKVDKEWDTYTGDTFGNPYYNAHSRHHPEIGVWDIDQRGTINAVYAWLRSLGVRWYFPGEIGEVVPQQASIALPDIDETAVPDFAMRNFRFFHEHVGLPVETVMWQLRLGTNYGHELAGLTLPGHGTKYVTTRDEMKEAHPEIYALWRGERALDHSGCGAPCLSHPLFQQKYLNYARSVFDTFGDRMISADAPDGYAWLCQCELCAGKDTPDRGWDGRMADYVWGFIDQAARELYKTHPDRMVSGLSYSGYKLPPLDIDQFSPNVAAILCQGRSRFIDDVAHQQYIELRQAWLDKLPSKELYIWDYYITNWPRSPYAGFPVYFPQEIAKDLRSLRGVSGGDMIEVYNKVRPDEYEWHDQATNHLNIYVTARLQWDVDQDLDAMLAEFYQLYYGPAAEPMQAFIEYSAANWREARDDGEILGRMFELLEQAQATAGEGIYGQRIQIVAGYMERLKTLRDKLAVGRENVPEARALRRSPANLTIDGKLDDDFWFQVRPYKLQDTQTGAWPYAGTTFHPAWGSDNALYLAIRCYDPDMENLTISTEKDNDTAIWLGDTIEILLETQVHTYYQITLNPAGAIMEIDRNGGGFNTLWTANGEYAIQHNENGWTVEIRLPVAGEDAREINPNLGIAGAPPSPTFRWYLNVCRQRVRNGHAELTAWSPTGKDDFHNIRKFGEVFVK